MKSEIPPSLNHYKIQDGESFMLFTCYKLGLELVVQKYLYLYHLYLYIFLSVNLYLLPEHLIDLKPESSEL